MASKRKGVSRDRMKKMMDKYGPSKRRQMSAQDGEEYANKPAEFFTRDIPNNAAALPGRIGSALAAPFKASTYLPKAKPVAPVAAPVVKPAAPLIADKKPEDVMENIDLIKENQRKREEAMNFSSGTPKVKKKNTSKMGLRGC